MKKKSDGTEVLLNSVVKGIFEKKGHDVLKIDLRKPEEVEAAITWCQQPSCFWGPIILTGKKLRQKFDTIAGQMLLANHGGNNGGDAKKNSSDAPPGSTSERRTSRGDHIYIPRQ